MKALELVLVALITAAITFATNWLALIPWRRARSQHWTERANAYHPAHAAAASNFWVLPAIAALTAQLLGQNQLPHWMLLVFATAIGTVAGTIPMDREVSRRLPLKDYLREVAVAWILQFLIWFVILGAAALMPDRLDWQCPAIAAVVLALLILWNCGGAVVMGKILGRVKMPPRRLENIVRNTASKMNVGFKNVYLLRSSRATAYALPGARILYFTDRLLDLLPDEEIAAVAAHELAHLTESRVAYYKRYVVWLTFLPWIFFRPLTNTYGSAGVAFMALFTVCAPLVYRRVSHKLEIRADDVARLNEPDPGVYARALVRIYEDNLLPAVNARASATHPSLYDRLIAAGVTPDFPRPKAPSRITWNGTLFAGILGGLIGALLIRMKNF